MTFRIVMTGFEPFLEHAYNPSWDVAQAAASELSGQAHCLRVDFETAKSAHRVFENDGSPGLLVHFGVAARRDHVAFERFAHNVDGGRDDRPQTRESRDDLVVGAPLALQTEVPLAGLVERYGKLADTEVPPAEISRDAGTYVCNAAYYHSLRAFSGSQADVLFIHVPMLEPAAATKLGELLGRVLASIASD